MNIVKFEGMSFPQLQEVVNKAMQMQNIQLRQEVAQIKENQEVLEQDLSITKEETQKLREAEIKRHRVAEHRFGFVGLSDLGQSYEVSIGAITMGKLLRLAGLAKQKQSRTEPMRSATLNNYAKSQMYGDYPTYQWNPEKCIEKVDRWLDEKGVIDEFYTIEDEKELTQYINKLYEKYGE